MGRRSHLFSPCTQVLWEVQSGRAVCGSPAHNNFSLTIKFFNNRNDKIVSAGNYNLLVWQYDQANNKLRHTEATLGQLQRIFRSVAIDKNDEFAYCGTTTGDVLQVSAWDLEQRVACCGFLFIGRHSCQSCLGWCACIQIGLERVLFKNQGPGKENVQLGAVAACMIPTGDCVIGGGDGSLIVMKTASEPLPSNPRQLKRMARLASIKLEGAVTSIVLDPVSAKGGVVLYVGTAASNIYRVTYEPVTHK